MKYFLILFRIKSIQIKPHEIKIWTFDSAIESFISAVESKGFYWLENPYDKSINVNSDISNSMVRMVNRINYKEQWQEAEEKTFRNPLIFVKKVIS